MNKETTFTISVPAKLNLSLAVTGKREGLHTLDMIVCPSAKYEDIVSFYPQNNTVGITEVKIDCALQGFDKARFKVALKDKLDVIARRANIGGSLYICKNIPLGAGMGGSSASIVGALKAIEAYCASIGKNMALDTAFLLSLGSDVPCMYKGGVCRVRGVGEIVERLSCDDIPNFEIVVVEGGADSGECYKTYDKLGKDYSGLAIPKNAIEALEINRNDLFEASCIVNPRIKETVERLKGEGLSKVFMTGSGSGLFYVI